jgi:uncharacterized membrane protein HdeD (DUF308 family)
VSSPHDNVAHASRYWPWVLVRALVAAVIAVIITFSADHSTALGFVSFGALAAASGAVLVLASALALGDGVVRWCLLAQGAIGIVLGAVALVFPSAGLGFLLLLIGAWAVLTGFLELYSGLRSRGRLDSSKDWLFVGGLTVVFAIVVLLVPADYNQPFAGPDGVDRALTASIILVGLLGAYSAVLGVFLVIAGLSLKWARRAVAASAAESGNQSW